MSTKSFFKAIPIGDEINIPILALVTEWDQVRPTEKKDSWKTEVKVFIYETEKVQKFCQTNSEINWKEEKVSKIIVP